jgi:hypothetical protein
MLGTQNGYMSCLVKSVFVTAEKEMESQLHGVSSSQPQLFAEIARSHDLRALPEQCLKDVCKPNFNKIGLKMSCTGQPISQYIHCSKLDYFWPASVAT